MAQSGRRKKKSLLLRLLLVGVVVYVSVAFVQQQVELSRMRYELAGIENETRQVELANQELKSLLDMRQDAEYIERVARDRLDYVYPDEQVFLDVSGN